MKNLRVWHIPQVPMKAFHVEVDTVEQAKLVLRTLADYDQFQFDNKIKPDYTNVQGLEARYDDPATGEWEEWADDNGDEISL